MTTASDSQYFFQQVMTIIAEQLAKNASDLRPEYSLRKDLGADSLDLIEILIRIEEDLGVKIPMEQANELDTIGDAIRLFERMRDERQALAEGANWESLPGDAEPDG
jgi:acyl carrier protein